MKKYLQKIIGVAAAIICVCVGCSRQPFSYKSTDTAMGTIINQTIYVSAGEKNAQKVLQSVITRIEDLEKDTLSWRLETSEVYKINAGAGKGQIMEVSVLLGEVLKQSQEIYAASEGAFDFTIGAVARLWNIDAWAGVQQADGNMDSRQSEIYVLPGQEQIARALTQAGADKISLAGCQIALPEGMQLDLGAVGKGLALDETAKILKQQKQVTGAVISVGGSVLTYGTKPDGNSWNVGIVDPFDTGQKLGILSLPGEFCVSTSGDYERYVEVDKVRYHHILDPHTGMPADSGVKSVTIVCSREDRENAGLFSDALSTACFVLGVEDGIRLAALFHAEALFVDEQGEIYMTEGMEQYFCNDSTLRIVTVQPSV